jgi:hypothetical protein
MTARGQPPRLAANPGATVADPFGHLSDGATVPGSERAHVSLTFAAAASFECSIRVLM